MSLAPFPVRILRAVLAGVVLALYSLSAQAGFLGDVSVRLLAPGGIQNASNTPIDATQAVTHTNLGTGISQGDNGAIGGNSIGSFGYMLPGETIFFDNATNSIRLHVAGGYDGSVDGGISGDISTGYLNGAAGRARYEISGLDIGATIIGFQAYAFTGYGTSGSSGLLSPSDPTTYIQIAGNTLVFDLDTLLFTRPATGSSNAFAEFRIDLVSQGTGPTDPGTGGNGNQLPEPGTLALFAIAALGAGTARRHA